MHRFCFSALILVVISLLTVAARAEEGAPPDLLPTLASIERLDPRFDALVPKDAVIEVLASGFVWAEEPTAASGAAMASRSTGRAA